MTEPGTVTLAIQAGGRSSRMGRDKGLVELGGRPLVRHVMDRLGMLADEILVTTNDPSAYAGLGVPTAADEDPGAGALDGLRTALRAAQGERVLVCACDMPFASRPLAQAMLGLVDSADAVVPRVAGEFEPLFAVYVRACLPAIERALADGRRRVISFFPEVRVHALEEADLRSIDADPWSFFNVNTPSDLELAEQHWRAAFSTEA